MPNKDASSGISPYDVEQYIRRAQREFNGIIGFDIGVPVRQVSGRALTVRCWFRRGSNSSDGSTGERGVSMSWPTGECRTFTGLLFRLVAELDKKLSEEMHAAERAKKDRLTGF